MARWRALEGDVENLLGQTQMFRVPRSHETKQGMNGGEPDIAGRYAALAFLLQVGEKRQDSGWVQIFQVKFRHWLLVARREKPEKQYKAVAVTMDGVRAGSADSR
jgi:hypothetical protein